MKQNACELQDPQALLVSADIRVAFQRGHVCSLKVGPLSQARPLMYCGHIRVTRELAAGSLPCCLGQVSSP